MVASHPNPVHSYQEALERIKAVQAREGDEVNPLCRSQLMTHGHTTDRAVLFIHGYTNCPRQFQELGKLFFERGYNVFNARMPYHGLKDRLTKSLSQLTANDLAGYTNEVVDIGCGLGKHLTLGGISAGGVAAAWAAQTRPEVNLAVIIAPNFEFGVIPHRLARPTAKLITWLPNLFVWWDSKVKANTKPDYAYPRFSTRSLGEAMRLGEGVRAAARTSKPLARKIILVTNRADPAVNNRAAYEIADLWEKQGAGVTRFEFDASLNLPHDIIDPNQPNPRTDVVYPKLIELIDQQEQS